MTTATAARPRPQPRKAANVLAADEARLRASLRRRAPSEPWVDAQLVASEDVDVDGEPITVYRHASGQFPPGGRGTAMVPCAHCGVLHPPTTKGGPGCHEHAVERAMAVALPRLIAEHGERRGKVLAGRLLVRLEVLARQTDDAFGASPSAAVIRELQMRNLRIKERKLPPEKAAVLRREIRRAAVR